MIIGIGSDIVNIKRIQKAIERFGEKFIYRIFTPYEINNAKKISSPERLYGYYAKRYAAKEAFVKALGIGFRYGVKFTDIEIQNDHNSKPGLIITGTAASYIKNYQLHISLSDDYPFAQAVVIIEENS